MLVFGTNPSFFKMNLNQHQLIVIAQDFSFDLWF